MTIPGVRLRPLNRDDLPLLARWLAEPLVARWWSDHSPERAEEEFAAELEDGRTGFLVVEFSGVAVGMVQRYRIADYPEYLSELTAAGVDVPAGAWSIDYLLGEPSVRGRGVGAAMVGRAARDLWADHPGASCLIVPVNVDNGESWGALLSAGFTRRDGTVELEPDNPGDPSAHVLCWLERPGGEAPGVVSGGGPASPSADRGA